MQKFATNFTEQIKTLEDICGPLVPVGDLIKRVEWTRMVGEDDEAVEETYTIPVLADEDEINKARNQFVACIFLAGVDRSRYKDAIDETNNDYLRHGKEYPQDVSSVVTWLLKRRGNSSNKKEDDTTDGIMTSFAQVKFNRKMKCVHCGKDGHLASDCFSLTPTERAKYREWQSICRTDDSTVSSNSSSRSVGSHGSVDSESSGSASGRRTASGRKATPPRKPRKGVFEQSNFAFGCSDKPTSFS